MDSPALDSFVRDLRQDGLRQLVVLTGAGISAESGIPTFRGPEGYWTVGSRVYRPEELATQRAFSAMPAESWRWYIYRLSVCRAAQPNPAHQALVQLERGLGEGFCLVTQNVDGLHLRAGSDEARTLQIHGNIGLMRCAAVCGSGGLWTVPDALLQRDHATSLTAAELQRLQCHDCGGLARPHVLWFDESYDETLFRAQTALDAAAAADLLVVVGTSGQTSLPWHMAQVAMARGAAIVDINPQDSPFADLARRARRGLCLREAATQGVPRLAMALLT